MLNKELLYKTIEKFEISLDDEAFSRLDTFAEMLIETNKSFNLTAIKEPDDVTVKHFADCLAIFKYVQIPENAKIIDVGTGAGFPGLVLKLARPDINMTFLDSTKKKLMFVDYAINKLGLVDHGRTLHMRAEEAGIKVQLRNRFDFSFSRAVANLRDLSEYCLPLTKVGGTFVALKGAKAQEEIEEAKEAIKILGGEIADVKQIFLSDMGERNIVVIKKVSPTPPKYPRASAKIAKEPLGMPKK